VSVRATVLAAIVTATAALVLALFLLQEPLVEVRQTSYTRAELLAAARYTAHELSRGRRADEVADRVGALDAARVAIFDETGRRIGDTAFDDEAIAAAPRPAGAELDLATERGVGWSVRDNEDGVPTIYGAIFEEGRLIQVSRPATSIDAARASLRELTFAGGLIAILTSALLAYAITRQIVGPIESVTRTADALAKGDLTARANIDRRDEIGRLGRSLDQMAVRLDEQLHDARAEHDRLRAMLDSMVEAVLVTSPDGRVILANRSLEPFVEAQALGKKVTDVVADEGLRTAIRKARKGKESRVELEAPLGGDVRYLLAHVTPVEREGGVIVVLHDVTDLKRADRIRRDFVANASHELRTPLTAIRGFAETLRDGAASDRETATRFLGAILRHTHRLQRLVDDLLALSRAESDDQKFELGPVELRPLARDVVEGLEARGDQRRVTVAIEGFEDLPAVRGNHWALEHVLVNLLDNALKYTREGGAVTLRARAAPAHVVLEVHDNGPGIAADHRERIFERFYRVDAGRGRDQGGTGLGLSIVKHLVQRIGAKIDVESELGVGTTFRVTLARADPG
jgi:two-component system, OmpR family, phosphate regulon sensor histidine kinase PhoR